MTHHINLDTLTLSAGAHRDRESGTCLLEAVAWWAGEPHSDRPACVSPVLAAFGRSWNDGMRSDEEREQLKPYIPLLVGTAGNPDADERRSYMALDWLVRVHTPAWLRLAGGDCAVHAAKLAALPTILNSQLAADAQPTIDAAGFAAGFAAGAAAGAAGAAGDTVRTAVRTAVRAAGAAAAATEAAGAAAAATEAAARAAVGVAAGVALEPTMAVLQVSAHDLYRRMIDA